MENGKLYLVTHIKNQTVLKMPLKFISKSIKEKLNINIISFFHPKITKYHPVLKVNLSLIKKIANSKKKENQLS